METILVLTDFSYAAFNAARYAVSLASQLQATEIVFYHAFNPATIDTPPPFASEIEDPWGQAIERLNELKTSLEGFADSNTKLTVRLGQESLSDAVNTINSERLIGLVVMGSTVDIPTKVRQCSATKYPIYSGAKYASQTGH